MVVGGAGGHQSLGGLCKTLTRGEVMGGVVEGKGPRYRMSKAMVKLTVSLASS